MPRRTTRPARPTVTAESPCPCGLPASYGACCGRFHTGRSAAPTAELLMRSRYSAFVVRDEAYLLRTWHPATRPPSVDFDPGMRWSGLEILDTTDGSVFHTTGTVTFVARYTHGGEPGALRERSRFARHEGAWVYVDGTFEE
ncbi:YchJ family protein [Streptomyces sp. NPDC001970]